MPKILAYYHGSLPSTGETIPKGGHSIVDIVLVAKVKVPDELAVGIFRSFGLHFKPHLHDNQWSEKKVALVLAYISSEGYSPAAHGRFFQLQVSCL